MGLCVSAPAQPQSKKGQPSPPAPAAVAEGPHAGAPSGAPRAVKRGAVGEAEGASVEGETLANLPYLEKSKEAKALIAKAFEANILFQELKEPELRELLVGAMTSLTAPPGATVIQQGDTGGDTFYVVDSGSCDVLLGERKVAEKGAGSSFGELALLYASPRSATLRVPSVGPPCRLWVLNQRWYKLVSRSANELRVAQKAALLRKVPFFSSLAPEALSKAAESCEDAEFGVGQAIIRKGEPGDTFYILRTGRVLVTDGEAGKLLGEIASGGHFGERALLSDEVRSATISVPADASAPVRVLQLQRAAFHAAVALAEETFRLDALNKGCPELAALSPDQLLAVQAAAEGPFDLAAGEVLYAQGGQMEGIVIVREGALAVEVKPPAPAKPCYSWAVPNAPPLTRGTSFGAAALLDGGAECPATLRGGAEGAKLLKLSRAAFEALIGPLAAATIAARVSALRRVSILADLPEDVMSGLAEELTAARLREGTAVVTAGERGDTFYLVERGRLAVLDGEGKEVARLEEGGYFGELALREEGATRRATVVVRGCAQANLLVMTRATFQKMRESNPDVAAGLARGEAAYAPLSYASSRIGLRDVQLKRALGVGTFGKVYFCLHQGQPYALKQIAKAQVVRKGLVQHVKRERDVMAECASTRFLVKLAASFQDSQSLYLMMELITGGELFYYLQSLSNPLSEGHARFYVACVVEAFTFLHSRFYIYRDLKPENLLLCNNGYLKVADFSFVKRLRGGKTQTLCGTPAYLAPEQIVRSGHDRAVDWWALGVLAYELLAGISPFYHDDDMTMYKRIMDVKYSFQPPACPKLSFEAKDLINGLLQKSSHQRLPMGCKGVSAVTEHMWFKTFDWPAFREGRMRAPYVPKLKEGGDDLRYFPDVGPDENPGSEYGQYTSVGNFAGF